MRKTALALAAQMTAAGITPSNVTSHEAYIPPAGGGPAFLRYAMDDNRQPVLGQWSCTLHLDGADWLLWNDSGSKSVKITHNGTAWVVA